VKDTAARTARNPQTGEEVKVPAGKKARFKPGKALKESLN
jgi:DNA-binding protein HU-beta